MQQNNLLMRKNIVITCFVALFATSMPASLYAMANVAEISAIDNDIEISVSGSVATVTNAQGQTLQIVSLTGKVVASYRIGSPSERIELSVPRGCYILKVGNVVRKISL